MESPESDLAQNVARLNERLAATRARLAAQEERLARLRREIAGIAAAESRPPAPPPARAQPERRRGFLPELLLAGATLVAVVSRPGWVARAQSAARLKDAVAAPSPALPRAAASQPFQGDNVVAEGLRLVYSYRPTPASVTVADVLRPLLGDKFDPAAFELEPIPGGSFWVVFKPYSDEVGLSGEYRFRVDPERRLVEPTPTTAQQLRVDAAGILASRSDFEGFRKALDLGGEGEVLVRQAADRVGR